MLAAVSALRTVAPRAIAPRSAAAFASRALLTRSVQTMKAAVVEKHGQPLVIKQVPIPEPGHGEVLIKVITSGVCHTDLHVRDGDWHIKSKVPIIPGHEGAGVVAKLGPGVAGLKIGDRVGHAWLHDSCGHCHHCLTGWETVCGSQNQTGFFSDGCFAEYTVAKADYVGHIPEGLPYAQASPILCAGVTTYKGLKETEVRPGEWVAILGASGGLGHVAVQYAHAMGMRVLALDYGANRVQYAKNTLKSEAVLDVKGLSNEQIVEEAKKICDGYGPNGALVLAPHLDSFRQSIDMIRPLGTAVGVSLPPGEFSIDPFLVILQRKTFRGSIVGTRADLDECLSIAAMGNIKCTVQERKLEEINEIFDEMKEGKIAGRVVLRLADDE